MKKVTLLIIVIATIFLIPYNGNAQCKNFAKKLVSVDLIPYVHDGIYNATELQEGETAELFKTFYSGQDYRLIISGDGGLVVGFEVLDTDRNVLFSNKTNKYAKSWDFKLESSQQLIIALQVQTTDEITKDFQKGCVAVLVGFLTDDAKAKKK